MNKICEQCDGACCKVKLFTTDWLQGTGAKSVHCVDEKSQKVIDGCIQIDKVCDHLKEGKCNIYKDRPQTCRDFKVGSEKCLIAMKSKNPELYNNNNEFNNQI